MFNFRAKFPEDLWLVRPDDLKEYNEITMAGYEKLAAKNILLCGITRNSAPLLKNNLLRIDYLRDFCNLKSIIYTNDNSDNTLDVLNNWGKDIIISETLNNKQHGPTKEKARYIDMAYYRNRYLERAKDIKFDYMIVLDLDTHGFSYDGIANSIYYFDKLAADFIGANGLLYKPTDCGHKKLYYDTLAYRALGIENDPRNLNLLDYHRGESPIKVTSCFGGLGIYTNKILNYSYLDDDCDHVTINRNLNCYINPSMIVLYSFNRYEY